MEKTHWKKVFNSDYLGSCDIDDGTDLKAIIKEVVVKKVKNTDGKEQERNVAIFTDSKLKPMILNATNCKVIKKFTKSPYINDWKNVAVQIYIKNDIKAFGDTTDFAIGIEVEILFFRGGQAAAEKRLQRKARPPRLQ